MRKLAIGLAIFLFAATTLTSADTAAVPRGNKSSASASKSKASKGEGKDFKEVIKDHRKVEGLFDLYINDKNGKMLLAIKPDQLGEIYMLGMSRTKGDGSYFDSGQMGSEFPFFFKRVNDRIQMLIENTLVRVDDEAPIQRALENGVGNSLYGSAKVVDAKPGPKDEILVSANDLLIRDLYNIGYFLGQAGQTGFSFDKTNSSFSSTKSFPTNTEISVDLHYKTRKPNNALFAMSMYSLIHTYHYSITQLPSEGFTPRVSDDRIGYFTSIFLDYTNHDISIEEASTSYVCRWRLEKEEPYAELSKPIKPITYWIDNATPLEYRKAVAEGVLFWNPSFEKIGYKDALVVKQRPDDADWDAADSRYNTIVWMIMPEAGYAVGPSRQDPFTGETYDADIRVSSDWLRWMWNYYDNQIDPVAASTGLTGSGAATVDKEALIALDGSQRMDFGRDAMCNFGSDLAQHAAHAYSVLSARNAFDEKDEMAKKFVHQYLVTVVAHEVGHTLGFEHNFKGSTFLTAAQLTDSAYAREHGMQGSVMDYGPANVAPVGKPQGEFFQVTPGPYDDWVVEYSYSDLEATTTDGERVELNKIAARSSDLGLAYGTDYDAIGTTVARSFDPECNYFDMGRDPLEYYKGRVELTDELWGNLQSKFENSGDRYQKLRRAFNTGWRGYREAGRNVGKYIGGYYHSRAHIGDPNAKLPFTPVPAKKQRAALNFLVNRVLGPDVFAIPASLLNKLQPAREWGLTVNLMSVPRADYSIHQAVEGIYNNAFHKLYASETLNRLHDQELRFVTGQPFPMSELFSTVRKGVWSEVIAKTKVNSFRRMLQFNHLNRLKTIYLDRANTYPEDARSLAYSDLTSISKSIDGALAGTNLDVITRSHLKRAKDEIKATTSATIVRN